MSGLLRRPARARQKRRRHERRHPEAGRANELGNRLDVEDQPAPDLGDAGVPAVPDASTEVVAVAAAPVSGDQPRPARSRRPTCSGSPS